MVEVEPYKISQVPTDVLLSVRDKWANVKHWSAKLWTECAMCGWINGLNIRDEEPCAGCPLIEPKFCCYGGSRSSLLYRRACSSSSEWRKNVSNLIEFIDSELERRKK